MSGTCADDLRFVGQRNKGLSRALTLTGGDPVVKASDFVLELVADIHAEFARPRVRTFSYTAGGEFVETTKGR